MSCIPKLLALKGDKEFLKLRPSNNDEDSPFLESGGEYKGYHFCITIIPFGTRCGYVALPTEHPYYSKSIDEDEFVVHGGITFCEKISGSGFIEFKELGIDHICHDKWIGFDAAHAGDGRDYDCLKKIWPSMFAEHCEIEKIVDTLYPPGFLKKYACKVKTNKYMENQCKKLIDQLVDVEKSRGKKS